MSMTSSNVGSVHSLHSDTDTMSETSKDPIQLNNMDNPEALEVVKQQKDILEQGINM